MKPFVDALCRKWHRVTNLDDGSLHWVHGDHNISHQDDGTYDLWWVSPERDDYAYLGTFPNFLAAAAAVSHYYTNYSEVVN